jgi:hypothetical protein
MSPATGIQAPPPSLFEVVSRRTLERPTRALLDREFSDAMAAALGDGSIGAEASAAPAASGGAPEQAAPRVDVRV